MPGAQLILRLKKIKPSSLIYTAVIFCTVWLGFQVGYIVSSMGNNTIKAWGAQYHINFPMNDSCCNSHNGSVGEKPSILTRWIEKHDSNFLFKLKTPSDDPNHQIAEILIYHPQDSQITYAILNEKHQWSSDSLYNNTDDLKRALQEEALQKNSH
jgi:hypothetical protein